MLRGTVASNVHGTAPITLFMFALLGCALYAQVPKINPPTENHALLGGDNAAFHQYVNLLGSGSHFNLSPEGRRYMDLLVLKNN